MTNMISGYFTKLKRLVNFLEKSKTLRGIFLPLRYFRDSVWFHKRTKGSYKWLAQFFDSEDLKGDQYSPLPLGLVDPKPIQSMKIPGLWNMNPSVSVNGSEVRVFTRATSFVFNPKTNSRGHNSLTTTDAETKKVQIDNHSIVRNALLTGLLTKTGVLVQEEVLLPESPPPTFEDVRPFIYKNKVHLIGTWTTQITVGTKSVITQSIAIYSIEEKRFSFLASPFDLAMEKNWVPIEVVGDKLMAFYSSQPARVLEIDLISSKVHLISINEHPSKLNFHGRSQFIRLPSGNFLRIASSRYPIKDFGSVHFSFLVEHNPDYEEIRISRPFLFQTPGFEICNGLQVLSENMLILTWGCNDRASYFSKVSINSLYEWLIENELIVKNPRSKNWRFLRGSLRKLESLHVCECKSSS